MTLYIPAQILARIHLHGEEAYPEEGAGLLLGETSSSQGKVKEIVPLMNMRNKSARHNRYQLSPEDYLLGEQLAKQLGLEVLGVFHSHPDHPNQPSEYDRQWAWPNFSYLITSVVQGKAQETSAWRLNDDRSKFNQEAIEIIEQIIK